MKKQAIAWNSITSAIQVVTTGVILFVLYRYLLSTIGVEQMGVWAVVLATCSVSRISELGLSGSVVKFVAKYMAHGEINSVSKVIQTAVISVSVGVGGILLLAYPFLAWVLGRIMPEPSLKDALSVLPYALISLWINAVGGVIQSGLDGCRRIDLRSFIMIGSNAEYLLLVILLAPVYGLMGLAYGQVIQSATVLLASWLILRGILPVLPPAPFQWRRDLFNEMICYGINFQLISVTGILFEPVTKGLLSKFGDLSMVGYYEMASRMMNKLREIFVAANQILVPVIAGLQEKTPDKIQDVYKNAYRILLCLGLPFYAGIIIAVPFISEIWIGRYERTFVVFSVMLALGTFFNSLNIPAYFAYMGLGRLRWNIATNIVTGALNCALGIGLGLYFGGAGVVAAWMFAWAFGSSVVIFAYHSEYSVSLFELFPLENQWLAIASSLGALSGLCIYYLLWNKMNTLLPGILCFTVFIMLVFPPLWFHPLRIQFTKWLRQNILPT